MKGKCVLYILLVAVSLPVIFGVAMFVYLFIGMRSAGPGGGDFHYAITDEYSLWRVNAGDCSLGKKGGPSVPPCITKMQIVGEDWVLGIARDSSKWDSNEGYFILNLEKDECEYGLTGDEWLKRLKNKGIEKPELITPREAYENRGGLRPRVNFQQDSQIISQPSEGIRANSPANGILTSSIGMKLVLVPPGEFIMGAPDDDFLGIDEIPQHRVYISKGFWMGQCEVTVGDYLAYLNDGGDASGVDLDDEDCPIKKTNDGYILSGNKFGADLNQPMVEVSWQGAVMFCEWLSKKEGKAYRLPTEAQWEYACRANTQSLFFYGGSARTSYDWFKDNSNNQTHLVGHKKANPWGLYDMHGNVREWCSDWYDEKYYENAPSSDPMGPPNGQVRVLRGGSWNRESWDCRSASRGWCIPEHTYYFNGFRVVMEL